MELLFLHDSNSMEEKAIAKNIRAWHAIEVPRLQAEIEKQTERQQKAIEALKKKETTKALEEERIFPFHYASVLCAGPKKKNIVMPFRYLMRPQASSGFSFSRQYFRLF